MITRMKTLAVLGIGCVAASLLVLPLNAGAQGDTGSSDQSTSADSGNGPTISRLDLENVDLYTAFTLLFTQAKVSYTLDPVLRTRSVSIHLRTATPFRLVLEALLRQSTAEGLPLTYTVQDGIYSIVPKVESTDTGAGTTNTSTEPTAPSWVRPAHIPLSALNFNAEALAIALGGRMLNPARNLQSMSGYGSGGMGGGMMGGGMGGMGGGMGGMGGGMMGGGRGGMGGGMGGGMMGGGMGGGMMGGGMGGGIGGMR